MLIILWNCVILCWFWLMYRLIKIKKCTAGAIHGEADSWYEAIHSSLCGGVTEWRRGKAFFLEEGGIREDDGWSKLCFWNPHSANPLPCFRSCRGALSFVGCDKRKQKHAFGARSPKAVSLMPPLRLYQTKSYCPWLKYYQTCGLNISPHLL